MASIVRPAMFQKTCLTAASKRAFSTKLTSSFPAINKPSSTISRKVVRNAFAKDIPALRVAAFHESGRRAILPPLPQVIQGTANDPAPVPAANPSHGSYHWTFERSMAVALIPLTIAPFASGSLNPTMDAIFCATILLHSHIGFESCIIDYIPTRRLPKTRKLAWWALRAGTVLCGVGLYEFETNDVGVTEAIKRIWAA
ncbi:related to succinate dehydrogenase precursor [Rhynchosporium secalis]|uniref:Succinate dehydrogenase [ubiquinone] cytochrome b small subunit n=1 Tax=Rhynchosporium secalis TaxID=38038 RepID=A0A1E1MDE4_RHYSE|nr:related to succinate dehydrogenase precursor [Rhynchosporium secalis]